MPPRKKGKKQDGSEPANPVKAEPEPVKQVKQEEGNKGEFKVNLNEEVKEEDEEEIEEEIEEEEEVEYEEIEEEIEEEEEEVEEDESEKVKEDVKEKVKEEEKVKVKEEEKENESNDEEVEEEEESEEEEEDEEEEESEKVKVKEEEIESETNNENKTDQERKSEDRKHAELLARPPQGSEIYIGNIPFNSTEEELRAFCEPHGDIFEVRVMKDNRGFAFVTYKTAEMALKAIEDLNQSEFKGKKVKCSGSQSKNRIFIGNVPRKWKESDLKNAINDVGPGVIRVDLMMDNGTGKSRGFAFVEYYNHACADYSLKKLSKPNFKLESNTLTVSWADPRGTSDSGPKSHQIKAVYVKKLPQGVSESKLRDLFEKHGEIEKVVLPPLKSGQEKRYAFVHFKYRADTMRALESTEKYEVDGEVIECSLAKPPASEKRSEPANQRAPPVMSQFGSRSVPPAYTSIPPAYLPPPMVAPPGMAMVPMVLPDGRLGYVLQQAGVGPGPREGSNNYYNNKYNNNSYNNNNNNNYRGGGGSGRGKRGYEGSNNNRGSGPPKRFRH